MFTLALAQTVQITQATVIAILAASTVVVVSLVALITYFASRTLANLEGGPLLREFLCRVVGDIGGACRVPDRIPPRRQRGVH